MNSIKVSKSILRRFTAQLWRNFKKISLRKQQNNSKLSTRFLLRTRGKRLIASNIAESVASIFQTTLSICASFSTKLTTKKRSTTMMEFKLLLKLISCLKIWMKFNLRNIQNCFRKKKNLKRKVTIQLITSQLKNWHLWFQLKNLLKLLWFLRVMMLMYPFKKYWILRINTWTK